MIEDIVRTNVDNLEGGESKYLNKDSSAVCMLSPNKVTWAATGRKGQDACFYLNKKSVLVIEDTTPAYNALTRPESDHCMINSSAKQCNIRTDAEMATVIHRGGGNIIASGWEDFVALLGGKGAKVQLEGYGCSAFSTAKHAHIIMTDPHSSGSIFASGAYTTINLTERVIEKPLSTVCSIGPNSTLMLARKTNGCFVRGKGTQVFMSGYDYAQKLLLGEGVRLFTSCYAGEKRQYAPVFLEGGKDLEADKVYEWDEETKWYKGLPYPISLPE